MRAPRSWAWSPCRGRSTRIALASAPSTTSRLALAPCCTRRATSTRMRPSPRSVQLEPELVFVVGWSQLVRDPFIELASEGVFGMHPTLLPRHRGRAPIPWAILTGLARTGVTLFEIVDATADSGPIVGQREVEISPDETATTLFARDRRCSRRAGQGAGAAAPGADGTSHPAGSQPCELLAEAQPSRRDHRLGDPRAVRATTGCALRRVPIPAHSRSSETRR